MNTIKAFSEIIIITAMPEEMRPIRRRLRLKRRRIRKGEILTYNYGTGTIRLLVSGIGKRNTRKNLRKLSNLSASTCVLITGVCGAVASDLGIGDIVAPAQVLHENKQQIVVNKCVSDVFNIAGVRDFVQGSLMTCDYLVLPEKKKAFQESGVDINGVDMEVYYCARFFKEQQASLYIMKTVSDHASMILPKENFLRNYRGRFAWLKQIAHIIKEPRESWRLLFLLIGVRVAAYRNAVTVEKCVRILHGICD